MAVTAFFGGLLLGQPVFESLIDLLFLLLAYDADLVVFALLTG
jgi:hypothetical protein